MSYRILILLDAPYPADARVKKEAEALLAAGFKLFLICLNKNGREPKNETIDGMRVTRINAGKKWFPLMAMGWSNLPFKKAAVSLIKQHQIDLLHVNDLPLVGTGLHIKKRTGVTVVADFHENYPEAIKTWFVWHKSPFKRIKNNLLFNPSKWFKRERFACDKSDHILAVVEEMKARLMRDHGTPSEKITVITNTEGSGFIQNSLDASLYKGLEGKFLVTYSGGLGPHRGIDTAIKAMALLKEYSQIQLVIIGSGNAAVEAHLKNLVSEQGLQNVHFLGHLHSSKMYSSMFYAGVNIIPHVSNGHTDNTIPHKLFQAMMSGRPLLVSSSAPLKRHMEMTNAGLVFEAGNDREFADRVLELYQNPLLCEKLGANGKKATLENDLNWEHTGKKLAALYQQICKK